MRAFWLLLLLITSVGWGQTTSRNPVLVLVQQDAFNPRVDPNTYVHPYWVRWPASVPPSGANRILSVATGTDWLGSAGDLAFEPVGTSPQWRSRSFPELVARGHFRVRKQRLGGLQVSLLRNRTGGTRSEALITALDESSPVLNSVGIEERWPEGKLMVMAGDGMELARLRRRTRGRILVIEYPPRGDDGWSRMWLYSQGWPPGLMKDPESGMLGVVPASRLIPLLLNPEYFEWREAPFGWPGANRWLGFLETARTAVVGTLGALATVLFVLSVYLVGQERRSAWLTAFLRLLALGPAALILGCAVSRVGGLNGAAVWTVLCLLALGALAAGVEAIEPRARWAVVAGISLVSVLSADPGYLFFSRGELLGLGLASVSALAMSLASARWWVNGTVFASFVALAIFGHEANLWWGQGWLAVGWVLGAAVGLGMIFSWALLLAVPLSPGMPALATRGVAFCQRDLISTAADIGKVNLYDHLTFAISPAVLGTLFLCGAAALFGSSFLAHQLRFGWRENPLAVALMRMGGGCALGGLFAPLLLHAALWCAMGSAIVIFDSLVKPISLDE